MKIMIATLLLSLNTWATPFQQATMEPSLELSGARCSCNAVDDRYWSFYGTSDLSVEDAQEKALYKCAIRSDIPASCRIDPSQFCGCR